LVGPVRSWVFVAWIVGASEGTSLTDFMATHDFAAFYLVSVAMGLVQAGFIGAIVWIARGTSAKDYNVVERRIDAWMMRMTRGGSDQM